MKRPRRWAVVLAGAICLAACGAESEPDEAAMREAIERLHREWAAEQRNAQKPAQQSEMPEFFRRLPSINLAFEANLALHVSSVRKITCRRAAVAGSGHVCRAVVAASMAGRQPIIQNIEGRFVQNSLGWQVRDLNVIQPEGPPRAP